MAGMIILAGQSLHRSQKSFGSGASTETRSPVIGCGKASVHA